MAKARKIVSTLATEKEVTTSLNRSVNRSKKRVRRVEKFNNLDKDKFIELIEGKDGKPGKFVPPYRNGQPIPYVIFGKIAIKDGHTANPRKEYDIFVFEIHNIPLNFAQYIQYMEKGWPILEYWLPEVSDLPAIDKKKHFHIDYGYSLDLRNDPQAFDPLHEFFGRAMDMYDAAVTGKGNAEALEKENAEYMKRIAELEKQLEERNARIAEAEEKDKGK